jgi:hypothetical protein
MTGSGTATMLDWANQEPGIWLGVTDIIGCIMTYYILKENGQVMARSTVWNPISPEQQTEDVMASFKASDVEKARRIGLDDFPVEGDKPDPALWVGLRERDQGKLQRGVIQGVPGYKTVGCQG